MSYKQSVLGRFLPALIVWMSIIILIALGWIGEKGNVDPQILWKIGVTILLLIPGTFILSFSLFVAFSDDSDEDLHASMLINKKLRQYYISALGPVEAFCVRNNIHPNQLTFLSFIFSFLAMMAFIYGWIAGAGWLIILGGTADILDGHVARASGRQSRSGAYFDSVMDRYAECAVYCGAAYFFRESPVLYIVLMALIGSLLVSYTRARAEGLGEECSLGIMQRPERTVILGFGAIFHSTFMMLSPALLSYSKPYILVASLAIIAVLSHYTAALRFVTVFRNLK